MGCLPPISRRCDECRQWELAGESGGGKNYVDQVSVVRNTAEQEFTVQTKVGQADGIWVTTMPCIETPCRDISITSHALPMMRRKIIVLSTAWTNTSARSVPLGARSRQVGDSRDIDCERRFGGVRRLYGEAALQRFRHAHVAVIGMGGVGSWAVEALVRSAVGKLTLVDLDNIAESNVNRQLHAVEGNFGLAKVTAMAQRVHAINPLAEVCEIEDFIMPNNLDALLGTCFDAVLDAIDDARAKVALAAWCRKLGIPLVMAGGVGGRVDPTRIRVADLAEVYGDRLLGKVRNQLRRDHGFQKGLDGNKLGSKKRLQKFGIACVYSDESVQQSDASYSRDAGGITGLNCAGYGSSVAVTAPCGMTAAAEVLKLLLAG